MSLKSELYDIRMEAFLGKNWRPKLENAYNEITFFLKIKASSPQIHEVIFYEGLLLDYFKHVDVWRKVARFRDLIIQRLNAEGVYAKSYEQSGNSFYGFKVDFNNLTT